jgi:hypothetical protein
MPNPVGQQVGSSSTRNTPVEFICWRSSLPSASVRESSL